MSIKLREKSKYALIVPTSMGVRITPEFGQPTHSSSKFNMTATSAETNVASISSYLGMPVKIITTFVKDSPVARFIKDDLRSRNMDLESVEVEQGGPWGYRHQFNIADSGYGNRGPRVHNDRAGEVGRLLNINDFDLGKIFSNEGVQALHLSGLIAALSEQSGQFCVELAKEARKNGTLISFDLNYRESFWINREDELRQIFHEIASLSDILVGNEEDFQLCLGIDGPESGGEDLNSKISSFKDMILKVKNIYSNAKIFTTTLREVDSANSHLWGAISLYDEDWTIIEPRRIGVLDRIGGGDGFVGGLLYGVLNGWNGEKSTQFGWASGALATTFLTDYAQPADEDMIWSLWEGNARVKR